MFGLSSFFSASPLSGYKKYIEIINSHEDKCRAFSDEALKNESLVLRETIASDGDVDAVMPYAFALVREAAHRTLGQRHYDVQLLGGVSLFFGGIAEMGTGEGKTLSATAPVYAHALTGKGVHVITVNDYLAQRDAVWMGQIYYALGMSTSCIVHDVAYMYDPEWKQLDSETAHAEDKDRDTIGSFRVQKDFLRPISRKEAYQADIVYGTNSEFGFDYLRDNLAYTRNAQVQRGHYFALIDEVDSILIDEARTPLIISAPDTEAAQFYALFASVVARLKKDEHYDVDEKSRFVRITDEGIAQVESMLSIDNLYDPQHVRLVHYLEESLKAYALFFRDRHYVVKDGEIIIVDEFTGRMMHGRRFSNGLHQALEAKEGVTVQQESKTYAQITIQNYFRLYEKVSGMTGTAETSSEEFQKVYGLAVSQIPTYKPRIRVDHPDLIFKTKEAKYNAITLRVQECVKKGQPVLVGTTSIDENELLSSYFSRAGIVHETLNAKNHEREGEIIAQAGRAGRVTLATNMAGRGVDIILGGNPPDALEAENVRVAGGLFVLGTQRNDARRIDNQLRGRSGRQGDPGETQFFLSLEDDMLRIFGGDKIKSLMTTLNVPEELPLESSFIVKVINEAQKKVEGLNFDSRKHLLEYDDVLNKQRTALYRRRQHILEDIEEGKTKELLIELTKGFLSRLSNRAYTQDVEASETEEHTSHKDLLTKKLIEFGLLSSGSTLSDEDEQKIVDGDVPDVISQSIERVLGDQQTALRIVAALDMFWTNHLENLEALLESVRMRAYGQKDPLVEYKRESYELFKTLIADAEDLVASTVFKQQEVSTPAITLSMAPQEGPKVGRNDACWCGSGKKYKRCHGA